jgi:outer membrane protein TolC
VRIRLIESIILVLLVSRAASGQTITLDGFLDEVRDDHPFFTKQQLNTEIAVKERDSYLGARDWTLTSSPYYVYQEPLASNPFTPSRLHALGVGAGAERAFWSTGGRFSVSWTTGFTDQELEDIVIPDVVEIPAGPPEYYENKFYVMYTQPLLQNFKGKLDRLAYDLAEYAIDISEIQALESNEEFLLDAGTRFLEWVFLTEQLRIAEERLALAEEQLEQAIRKREANLVDEVDVLRAEDAVRMTRQNIMFIELQWKSKRAELAVLAQSEELYEVTPEFDIYRLVELPSIDEAVAEMKQDSRLLELLEVQSVQLAQSREGIFESGRAQLNLNVGAGLMGGDDDFGGSLTLDSPDLLVSLDLRYPLSRTTMEADLAKTDLQLRLLEKEIENVSLDLEAAIRNLLIQIDEMEGVLLINQEHIESARAKTEEELRMYNQGRSMLTFVIQSRDDEQQAKLTYAQNAASYHQLVLTYRAVMDELLIMEYEGELR